MKIYTDPAFGDGIVLGYKGSTSSNPPPGRTEFGPGADWKHHQCVACGGVMNPAECPDKDEDLRLGIRGSCLVWHGWHCSQCGGTKENHAAFEASMSQEDFKPDVDVGFFYCPYIPDDIIGKSFKVKQHEN